MTPRLPRLVVLLLRLLPADMRRDVTNDLAELHADRRIGAGRIRAFAWLLLHAGRVVWQLRRARPRASVAPLMAGLLVDLHYVLRRLRHAPAFALVAVATFALGIGATTAVFSLAHAIWLKPLPFADPSTLAQIQVRDASNGVRRGMSSTELQHHLDGTQAFTGIASYVYGARVARVDGSPVRVVAFSVSPSLFELLGTAPALGRSFRPEDAGTPVLILSDDAWRTYFTADPDVVGRSMRLFDTAYTVLGVMPPAFRFPATFPSDIWVPVDHTRMGGPTASINAIGRLRPGVGMDQASADAARIAASDPANDGRWTARAVPLVVIAPGYRTAFGLLLGIVGLFLLIACANVASLLVARNLRRRHELRLQTALGAARWRLVRQLLIEAGVLALAGGVGGAVIAGGLVDVLRTWLPADTPRLADAALSPAVLAFAAGVVGLTALASSLAPTLTLRSLGGPVTADSRATAGSDRAHRALVVIEAALATVLLVGAALMMRSFVGVLERDRGYAPEGVVSLNVTLPLPSARFDDPAVRAAAFDEILSHVGRIPGVTAAGATNGFPGSRLGVLGFGDVRPVGRQVDTPITAALHSATPDFFRTMGVALERGRFFDASDRTGSAPVVIVNASLAAKLWPGAEAVGQRVQMDDGLGGGDAEVVGVVEDMRLFEESVAGLYRPLAQKSGWWVDLVARTDGDAQAMTERIRTSLRAFNADLLLENESALSAIVQDSVGLERAQSLFTSALAMLGCLLAAMGVSALLTYDVARRTREMGVRLALGCRPADLYRSVVRRGVLLASTGVAIGCIAAIVAVSALRSTVFGLESGLLAACATAVVLILVSSLVAAAIPARRVVRTDPLEALRIS